ncbi:SCAN domain-containing protein 3-like [Octopus sinensis]|uniref:SCAN domain-containing protein 3-like n=1 Tax=Octopus sinensis TaxID=2607531 RepID=A0A6P7SZP4_9MOLL|nr:SCAN domain-containing protein 3-like [Octopus sinensis]
MSKPNKKKTRQYAVEFLKFGFIPDEHDEHLEYFKSLKEKFKNRTKLTSLFHAKQAPHTRALEASYEISLLIAKHGKNHTIGEQLIKPAISIFLKTVLQKDDGDIRTMPLSNNTVSNRIDEMGQDVESQLIEKLKLRKFSLQMDESTIRDSEALLLTYVRYIDHEEFQEEMLFCESFKRNSKSERLFKQFCINQSAEHVRLLLHTEVRWLSSGNCLKRFMELFDQINDFLSDKCEMKLLSTTDGKAFVSYLTDIFEKLGNLNKQLQGANMTLIDAKQRFLDLLQLSNYGKRNFPKEISVNFTG